MKIEIIGKIFGKIYQFEVINLRKKRIIFISK